ncbi:hypothetical protein, partial [Corynebacterium diphtheriae]|uniref:hypothetical protein n=1 Tax=Corynebacterium diphtheriae TaxID=1717 RepID=UPI000A6BC952
LTGSVVVGSMICRLLPVDRPFLVGTAAMATKEAKLTGSVVVGSMICRLLPVDRPFLVGTAAMATKEA